MKPELVTRESMALEAADRWREQYAPEWGPISLGETEAIYKELVALGSNPSPNDVDRVIGNGSWTRTPECDACGDNDGVGPRVLCGEKPSYETSTTYLCPPCLKEAVALLPGETSA